MKRLILMRHAKSSWSDETLADIDRPLNERGRNAARVMGQWMRQHGHSPDIVLVSPAVRCRDTLVGVRSAAGATWASDEVAPLYAAEPQTILEAIRMHGTGDTVMVVGHQPGIGAFARAMRIDPPPQHPQYMKYPTGTVTVLEVPIADWSDLGFGSATLLDQASPKQVAEA